MRFRRLSLASFPAFAFLLAGVARADDPPPAPAIELVVDAEEYNAGSKLDEPLRDVPATVNSVTAKTIRERGVTDLAGALQGVAGVNPMVQYGGFTFMTIRGFEDFVVVVDGMRDDRYFYVESAPTSNLADVSRIDVLKGPSSALYGYGGIGGIVSITHKAPTLEPTYEASISLGYPRDLRRASAGVGGPIAGTHLSYRLDVGVLDDLDFRNVRNESGKISGAIEWRPNDMHRVLVRAGLARDHFGIDTGIPVDDSGHVPGNISLNRRFNTPWDYLAVRTFDVSARYDVQPTSWLELTTRASYTFNPYSYQSAESLGIGPNNTVTRDWFALREQWHPFYAALEARLTGKALVPHRALVGYELGVLHAFFPRPDFSDTGLAPVPFGDALDPQGQYGVRYTGQRDWTQITHAVYAHDTLTLLPQLKAALGARVDDWSFTQATTSLDKSVPVTATNANYHRHTTSPTFRAGLVYQPLDWGTLYGSIATAFRPARNVPADGHELSPEKGRQFELGARAEFLQHKASLNLAVYDIEKTNVVVDRGLGVIDQAGRQGSRGIEVDAGLKPFHGFTSQIGYAYTRARFKSYVGDDGVDYSGKTPPNVSAQTFTSWSTYRLKSGLGFGLGVRVVGTSYADPANHVPLDTYAMVDAAAFYKIDEAIELAFNLNNVFDTRHYFVSAINGSQLTPGAPRVGVVSVRIAQ